MTNDADPDQPGWLPGFDPTDQRDVGTGADFGADLFALYESGRTGLPETAALFSGWASVAHDLGQRTAFLRESVGGEHALDLVDALREELQVALRRTAVVMADVGEALVATAADYARTDETASATFAELVRREPALRAPKIVVPRPPRPGEPWQTPYVPPSLEAPEETPWGPVGWFEEQVEDALETVVESVVDAAVETAVEGARR